VNVAPEPAAARSEVSGRSALRARLLGERDAFVASSGFAPAAAALAGHLRSALVALEPGCLGLYWPMRSEFNAAAALAADAAFAKVERALPYARREARAMDYRRWDGAAPTLVDECGIGTSDGAVVVPDVVVVPCVGFSAGGHRLGSGAGYYDRWLAAHPHVVAVGVAWDFAEIDVAALAPEPHDVALAFVVTESGAR
jgi:5-formyltetrahydrofolate cyclo-ligase